MPVDLLKLSVKFHNLDHFYILMMLSGMIHDRFYNVPYLAIWTEVIGGSPHSS